jgi:hypothetical protein
MNVRRQSVGRDEGAMSGNEQIRILMGEIGPILDLAEVYEGAGGNAWTLAGQDETILFVEFIPDDDRLWLSGEVGTPPPDDRLRLYSLMLQYNARWQETGGIRLALDAPEGAIVQAYDMPAAGLDLPRLCTVIRNFRNTLDGWRRIAAGAEPGRGTADPAPDWTAPDVTMIRG